MLRSLLLSGLVVGSMASATEVKRIGLEEVPEDVTRLEFSKGTFRADQIRGNVGLHFDEEGFSVSDDEGLHRVQRADVDPELRDVKSVKDMARVALTSTLQLKKFQNGGYRVLHSPGLKGGGIGGAWLGSVLGKGLVHFVGHGLICIAAAFTGPAAPATFAALEASLAPTVIEPLSIFAALAGGMALGVATGPA